MRVTSAHRLVVVLCALLGSRAWAHEVSLQQCTVDFLADGTWHLVISVDPLVLLVPEATAQGADPRAAFAALTDDERHVRRERVRELFATNVLVRFDDVPVVPLVRIPGAEPIDDEFDRVRDGVVLSGRVPAGARIFLLSTTRHLSPMVLILRRPGDDEPVSQAVDSGATSEPYRLDGGRDPSPLDAPARFVALGFLRIIPFGPAPVLFVIGVVLLSARLRPLLIQLACFTAAHCLTLGLVWFGLFNISSRLTNMLIALSLVALAVSMVRAVRTKPWWLPVIVAAGLAHGLGFAEILSEPDLPPTARLVGLVSFILGIESGLAIIVIITYAIAARWRGRR